MANALEPPVEFSNGRMVQLQERFQGRVITPVDPGDDEARRAWNLLVDQYPTVIVMAESAEDVAVAVRFAKSEGLNSSRRKMGPGAGPNSAPRPGAIARLFTGRRHHWLYVGWRHGLAGPLLRSVNR
ncbi:MAG TPA: hypothetical protein VLE70_13990 [Anaerolineae bacterium]|nr:hypothetical protein [Anaerolineae bacterium]